jgi:hypothetical protein
MNEDLKTKLRVWAYERLWDHVANGEMPEDEWHEVDDSIPELAGKLDVNIFIDMDGIVRACAYDVITLPNGLKTTNCETWLEVF